MRPPERPARPPLAPRLRIRRRSHDGRHVLKFEGEVDGSTACHALDVVARTPQDGWELEIDLSGVRLVERFGVEVLARGLSHLARVRRVRIVSPSELGPAVAMLVQSVQGSPAA
jgi:anti-anti-sigma regulatory factor